MKNDEWWRSIYAVASHIWNTKILLRLKRPVWSIVCYLLPSLCRPVFSFDSYRFPLSRVALMDGPPPRALPCSWFRLLNFFSHLLIFLLYCNGLIFQLSVTRLSNCRVMNQTHFAGYKDETYRRLWWRWRPFLSALCNPTQDLCVSQCVGSFIKKKEMPFWQVLSSLLHILADTLTAWFF